MSNNCIWEPEQASISIYKSRFPFVCVCVCVCVWVPSQSKLSLSMGIKLRAWALILFVSHLKKYLMKILHGFTIGIVAVSNNLGDSGTTKTTLVTILTWIEEILARLWSPKSSSSGQSTSSGLRFKFKIYLFFWPIYNLPIQLLLLHFPQQKQQLKKRRQVCV